MNCEDCKFVKLIGHKFGSDHYVSIEFCNFYKIRTKFVKDVCNVDEEEKISDFDRTMQQERTRKENKRDKKQSRKRNTR